MSAEISRKHFSVDEYYRMAEVGILAFDKKFELIEGEVIQVSPIGARHAARVDRINKLFNRQLNEEIVRVQNPVRLGNHSEPEPDVSILKPRKDFYEESHPTPEDVLLIIEITDTSGVYDRNVKIPMYARAGITEVWIMDVQNGFIEVHKDPINGTYQEKLIFREGQYITPQSLPHVTISVDSLFK
jgi:Uma2 family endonuclease